MTGKRLNEIMEKTIEKIIVDVNFIPLDRTTAYNFGLMLGELRKTLKEELLKELDEEISCINCQYHYFDDYCNWKCSIENRQADGVCEKFRSKGGANND